MKITKVQRGCSSVIFTYTWLTWHVWCLGCGGNAQKTPGTFWILVEKCQELTEPNIFGRQLEEPGCVVNLEDRRESPCCVSPQVKFIFGSTLPHNLWSHPTFLCSSALWCVRGPQEHQGLRTAAHQASADFISSKMQNRGLWWFWVGGPKAARGRNQAEAKLGL